MYGALITEMAQVAEQEHMQEAIMARPAHRLVGRAAAGSARDGLPARGLPSGRLATWCSCRAVPLTMPRRT